MHKAAIAAGVVFAAALAVWPVAQAPAADKAYKAILRGGNEKPPVKTQAKGTAAVTGDPASKQISWNVTFDGLSGPATAAYIRCEARVGAGGAGIAVQLGAGPNLTSPLTGSGQLDDAQFADLRSGRCWVNVVTATNQNGEISGRLHR
jgi:CHRD domain